MKKIEIKTVITEYESIQDLPENIQNLIHKSIEVTKKSYAPYSNFNVGAAVLLENKEIICGSNQENAAYPSGLCAERVAMFYANSKYPDIPIEAIAIVASQKSILSEIPAAPCGSCRQALLETENRFKKPITIYLVGKKKITKVDNVHDLLPISFDGEFLRKG